MTAAATSLRLARPLAQSAQLHDLWQSEEQLAWRLDAWLIKYLRAFPQVDPEAVGQARRQYGKARQALRQRISQMGRAVVRIPFVASPEGATDLSRAARELQGLHHELARARNRAEAASFAARRDRDFATVNVLTSLDESHRCLLALVRELFQRGQQRSRELVGVA